MATHAESSARLLRDAAVFFRTIGAQNKPLEADMNDNAGVFEQMAELITREPLGETTAFEPPQQMAHKDMAAYLLRNAASFFITVGEQNNALMEMMKENATVFEQVAALVEADPLGLIETE
jgi:hypothetical protein